MSWHGAANAWIDPPPGTHENSRLERVAFSVDGQYLLGAVSTQFGSSVTVYTADSLEPVATCKGRGIGVRVGDEVLVAAGPRPDAGGFVYQLRLQRPLPDGGVVREIGEVRYAYSLARSADGRLAAVGGHRTFELWDVEDGRRLAEIDAHRSSIGAVALSPDGRLLVSRSFNDMAVWDVASGDRVGEATGLAGPSCEVAFSPDGRCFASGHDKSAVAVWRVSDLTVSARLPVGGYQLAVAFSPDGTVLATAGQDEVVHLWPLDRDEVPVTLHGPVSWVRSLAFAPDGQTLVAASGQRIHLWQQASSPAPPPDPPPAPNRVPVLMDNARRSAPLSPPPTVEQFVAQATRLPWFACIGKPSRWDDGCVRISSWQDWPGPEDEASAIDFDNQRWKHAIDLVARSFNRPELTELFARTQRSVEAAAAQRVPVDDDLDVWYGPNACVVDAGIVAAIIACFLEVGWQIPPDIQEQWAWYAAGHWPCGYAYDNSAHEPPFRLLVL